MVDQPVSFVDKVKLWLSSYSPAQVSVALRKLVEYSSVAITVLTMLHVSPSFIQTVNDIFANINSNQAQIIGTITSVVAGALYIFSLFKTSTGQQIKTLEKTDGVVVGVDTSSNSKAPAVAIAAAKDEDRKSVVELTNVPDKAK